MKIEGIPDGWELVRVGCPTEGEFYLGMNGQPIICSLVFQGYAYLIIRRIEKPEQYRPFANAEEAEALFDRRLRYKACCNAIMRITVLGEAGIEIAEDKHTYKQAFDRFECTDGTPFGIEVTE